MGERERRGRPGPQQGARESRDRETWCFFTRMDKHRYMSKGPDLETDTKTTDFNLQAENITGTETLKTRQLCSS